VSHDTKTLILVPTELKRSRLRADLGPSCLAADRLELCGFGPVAAAARTATLLARDRPDRVLLVGIAGAIDARLSPGSARRFAAVACHGIGAGSAADFAPAGALGWPHWPGDDGSPPIGDTIPLDAPGVAGDAGPLLLTVCAASGSAADVAERRRLFPAAVAEDMEGFGVALACRLHGVPCAIIRGISNVAGDRDKARWATAEALAAAAALAHEFLAEA
jgi:futalosine hydrolase